jgi:hypothetical protein
MQRLASTLNKLTSSIGHRIAFEAVDTSKMFDRWHDGQSLNVILGGKLKVILN